MLYRKGYNKEQIVKLFSFIDWLITLPKELEEKITDEIIKIEEAEKMTYVTSFERIVERRKAKEITRKIAIKMLESQHEMNLIKMKVLIRQQHFHLYQIH